MDDIRKEDLNKLIEVKAIDETFIASLKTDYEEIKKTNIFDAETTEKIAEFNKVNLKSEAENADLKNENYLKKKRRRTQYEKESLISDWVDANDKIFDEENFMYMNDEREVQDEYEESFENEFDENQKNFKLNELELKEEGVNEKCGDADKKKFCLYCSFFKMFEC